MRLDLPINSVDAIRNRLPNEGYRFSLLELVDAMEVFYSSDRLNGCEEDSLLVVAGKYGKNPDRRFEIAFFRSFDLSEQLEVSIRYPVSLRSLFLATASDICESLSDTSRFFSAIRAAAWYRRFKSAVPNTCSIRWRDESEMADLFCEVAPKLIAAMGPDWCNG